MKLLAMSLLFTCFNIAIAAETSSDKPPVDHNTIFQHATQSNRDIESMNHAEVLDVIHTKGYTYIEVTQGEEPLWLAVPTTEVEVGDTVHYTDGPIVQNHSSRTLNRTFPSVIFLLKVVVNSK